MERRQSRGGGFIDRYFKITERGSTISTEIRAGVVTFLTMSYILLVNPQILANAGLPVKEVVASTGLTSCLASFLVGIFANLPVGIAPGMGLNAYMVFSQVLGMGVTVQVALGCCMTAAILVAILALIRALSLILALVPDSIKLAVVVGMGLLLSFIGLQTAKVVVRDEETMVKLGDLGSAEVMLALLGLTLIATLHHRQVPGAILIGITLTALSYFVVKSSWPHEFVDLPALGWWNVDMGPVLAMQPDALSAVGAYALVMIFDIGGAMYGLGNLAGLVKDGAVPGAIACYLSAAAGTALGAVTGTTPLIIAAESAVGIKEGGRTGLVAVTVSACFGIALFFAPILQAVPPVATAPVLVLVGAMMMGEAGHINWTSMTIALPAFLTMVIQPFTFSIANGIYAGLLFSFVLWITTGEFITYFRTLIRAESAELGGLEAGNAAGLHEPLMHPQGGGPGTSNFGGSNPVDFGKSSTWSNGGNMSSATNIVRSVSRRIMNDIAASPHYTSTQHDLLIGTPTRPGFHASYGTSAGQVSHLDGSTRGGQYFRTSTSHQQPGTLGGPQ